MNRTLQFAILTVALMVLGGKIIQISATSSTAAESPQVVMLKDLTPQDPSFRSQFNDIVRSRFRSRQFAELDAYAANQRQKKERMPDGSWLLSELYEAIREPREINAPEAEYLAH